MASSEANMAIIQNRPGIPVPHDPNHEVWLAFRRNIIERRDAAAFFSWCLDRSDHIMKQARIRHAYHERSWLDTPVPRPSKMMGEVEMLVIKEMQCYSKWLYHLVDVGQMLGCSIAAKQGIAVGQAYRCENWTATVSMYMVGGTLVHEQATINAQLEAVPANPTRGPQRGNYPDHVYCQRVCENGLLTSEPLGTAIPAGWWLNNPEFNGDGLKSIAE